MRRVAVVTSDAAAVRGGPEVDEALDWLGGLPTGGVSRFGHFADVPLEAVDVVWVRRAVEPHPGLIDWLGAGGRVLATGPATLLPATIGLEREAPRPAPSPNPLPAGFGLAGFGAHPLFAGLRDGALLVPVAGAGDRTLYSYDGDRPATAGVVAMERRGLDIRVNRILAWEYAVGHGGVLCVGFEPSLLAYHMPHSRREAEVVLANAVIGEAIPHRDRAVAATLWLRPGRRSLGTVSDVPLLLAPADEWPASTMPVLDLAPGAPWAHAGRRMLVSTHPATGRREVWAPPFRVMHEAGVRDAIPCAPWHVAADEIGGGLALGEHRLLERWVAAPDVAAAIWEIGGPEGVELLAEWTVDLRRAWPYPAGSYGDLTFAVAADGLSLGVSADGGPCARFAVIGGTLAADGSTDAPVVHVTCSGVTPLRIVVAAGVDPEELRRSGRVLERDGAREIAGARARKASQLRRYGTAFEAADQLLTRGFEWARQRGDEALVGSPGVGRSLLAACPRGAGDEAWCFGVQACAFAAAQLVAGNRDPARELLKFLAQTQHPGGGIAAHHPLGGLASAPDAPSTVAFLDLAGRLLAWTGDLDTLRRFRGPLAAALDYLAAGEGATPSNRVLDGIESLLDDARSGGAIAVLRERRAAGPPTAEVEAHAIVEAAAAALRRGPGALPGSGAAPALLEAVAALWGLEPDAPDGALTVAPLVPAGWDGFALRRLRVGRTLLDLEVWRKRQALVVRTARLFGPRLVVTVGLRGVDVESTEVDDVALPGPRARFEAHDRHEIRFLLRG